jgi:hypothetical protein
MKKVTKRKENELLSVMSAAHDLRLKRGRQKTGSEAVQDRVQSLAVGNPVIHYPFPK